LFKVASAKLEAKDANVFNFFKNFKFTTEDQLSTLGPVEIDGRRRDSDHLLRKGEGTCCGADREEGETCPGGRAHAALSPGGRKPPLGLACGIGKPADLGFRGRVSALMGVLRGLAGKILGSDLSRKSATTERRLLTCIY
jgi:hypothetical protein